MLKKEIQKESKEEAEPTYQPVISAFWVIIDYTVHATELEARAVMAWRATALNCMQLDTRRPVQCEERFFCLYRP